MSLMNNDYPDYQGSDIDLFLEFTVVNRLWEQQL